tara:strand:- start:4170 stop:4301 length:132 start_codon:yes stop_codon:yes gene_type:complete
MYYYLKLKLTFIEKDKKVETFGNCGWSQTVCFLYHEIRNPIGD